MKLNLKAVAGAAALVWGAAMLLVGTVNLAYPAYGHDFLILLSSIYPGYHASGALSDVIVGTLYAVADGAVFGLVFGWIYNRITTSGRAKSPIEEMAHQTPVEP